MQTSQAEDRSAPTSLKANTTTFHIEVLHYSSLVLFCFDQLYYRAGSDMALKGWGNMGETGKWGFNFAFSLLFSLICPVPDYSCQAAVPIHLVGYP
jgi:hypothetical protein